MEKERENFEDELDVEDVDDISEDEEDVEEFDFNDEDDDEADDDEVVEDDESEETEEPDATEEAETDDGEVDEETASGEAKPDGKLTPEQERELALLHRLGYEGSYEEAVAAYENEQKKPAEGESTGTEEKPAEAPAVDYEAMAKQMLADINKEYGLELKDYSEFEDLATFAELSRDEKVGPIKAFAATNPKLMASVAMKEAMSKLSKPKRSVPTLPKSEGGKGGVARGEAVSSRKIAEYKAMFPHMSRNDIIKLINRGNRSIK